jgi:hypothetical protein
MDEIINENESHPKDYGHYFNDKVEARLKGISLSVVQYLDLCRINSHTYKFNKKKLCKNMLLKGKCDYFQQGKCHFAHSFFEIDSNFQYEIVKLGLEAYYHLNEYDYKKYRASGKSLISYINKIKEEEYNNKILNKQLKNTKLEYTLLTVYAHKLYKEQQVLCDSSVRYSNVGMNTDVSNIIYKFKKDLNHIFTCKICYKSIFTDIDDTDDVNEHCDSSHPNHDIYRHNFGNTRNIDTDNNNKKQYTYENNKYIVLYCGHSICHNCHINLINEHKLLEIKCPICRRPNDFAVTRPNYELNQLINQSVNIIKNLETHFLNLETKTSQQEKSRYFTKHYNTTLLFDNDKTSTSTTTSANIKDNQVSLAKVKLTKKAHECPW